MVFQYMVVYQPRPKSDVFDEKMTQMDMLDGKTLCWKQMFLFALDQSIEKIFFLLFE